MKQPVYPEKEAELLETIGVLLILLQDVERFLSAYIKMCLPGPNGINVKKLLAEDKRTLSDFIRDIKKRADLEPEFEVTLSRLLTNRNIFIHSMRFQPWFDTSSPEGQDSVWRFLAVLQNDIKHVLLVIQTALFTDLNLEAIMTDEEHRQLDNTWFHQELNHYKTRIDSIIKKKPPT